MATNSDNAFRLPAVLIEDVRMAAELNGTSFDRFVVQAVTEKLMAFHKAGQPIPLSPSAQKTYLEARAATARSGDMQAILAKAGKVTALQPGDEIPDGWLDEAGSTSRGGACAAQSHSSDYAGVLSQDTLGNFGSKRRSAFRRDAIGLRSKQVAPRNRAA